MKRTGLVSFGLIFFLWGVKSVFAQGDLAVYETYTRFAPAVFSLRVEIPKEQILQSYEDSIKKLRDYQDNYADIVTGGTRTLVNYNLIESMVGHWQRQLDVIKNQMLTNNQVQGVGFAVSPHHIVTISTLIKSATILVMEDNKQIVGRAMQQGIDPMIGIAVLRVDDATFSHYVDLDHPSITLPVASYVMTIQRPYDLPATLYPGMIGGYMRQLNLFPLERYIQTDLPLFLGNEGAPVFSPTGQLIGMMATEFHVGRYPAISFVIPAKMVAKSALALMENGKKEYYGFPGLALRQVSAKTMDKTDARIQVEYVDEESTAFKAGIRKGDLILEYNGININQLKEEWMDIILDTKPQEKVILKVLRGNETLTLPVTTDKLNR